MAHFYLVFAIVADGFGLAGCGKCHLFGEVIEDYGRLI